MVSSFESEPVFICLACSTVKALNLPRLENILRSETPVAAPSCFNMAAKEKKELAHLSHLDISFFVIIDKTTTLLSQVIPFLLFLST